MFETITLCIHAALIDEALWRRIEAAAAECGLEPDKFVEQAVESALEAMEPPTPLIADKL